MLNGLFDLDFRVQELAKGGDPLPKLNAPIGCSFSSRCAMALMSGNKTST